MPRLLKLLSKRLRMDLQAYLMDETENHPLTRIDLLGIRSMYGIAIMNRTYDEQMKALDDALARISHT